MKEDSKRRCETILRHYGIEKQSIKACEEMGELIQVISKLNFKFSSQNVEHLKEEIADVMVVLEQLKIHYGITDNDIDEIVEQKTIRTVNHIRENTDGISVV